MPSADKNKEQFIYHRDGVKFDDQAMAGAALTYFRCQLKLIVLSYTPQLCQNMSIRLSSLDALEVAKDANGAVKIHYMSSDDDKMHELILPVRKGASTNAANIIGSELLKLYKAEPWKNDRVRWDYAQYPTDDEAADLILKRNQKPKKTQSALEQAFNPQPTAAPHSASKGRSSQGDKFVICSNSAAVDNHRHLTQPHYSRPKLTLGVGRPGDSTTQRPITKQEAHEVFEQKSKQAKQQSTPSANDKAAQYFQSKHVPASASNSSATTPRTAYSLPCYSKPSQSASQPCKNQPSISSYCTQSRPAPTPCKPIIRGGELRGMRNLGNSCYINSVVQALFAQPCFAHDLVDLASSKHSKLSTPIPIDPSSVYSHLVALREERMKPYYGVAETRVLKTALDMALKQFVGDRQQDAHEFLTETFNRLNDDVVSTFIRDWRLQHNLPLVISSISSPRPSSTGVNADDDEFDRVLRDEPSEGVEENASPVADVDSASAVTAPSPDELRSFEANALHISPVQRNFHCAIRVKLVCANPECKHERSNVEHFNVLSLDMLNRQSLERNQSTLDSFIKGEPAVPDYMRNTNSTPSSKLADKPKTHQPAMSIELLLREFFKDTEREYRCEKCKHNLVRIQSQIVRLPRVLVLHIKRFATDDGITIKKRNDVVVVGKELDLSFACDSEVQRPELGNYPPEPEWIPSKAVEVNQISDDDEPDEQSRPKVCSDASKPIPDSIVSSIKSAPMGQDASNRSMNTLGKTEDSRSHMSPKSRIPRVQTDGGVKPHQPSFFIKKVVDADTLMADGLDSGETGSTCTPTHSGKISPPAPTTAQSLVALSTDLKSYSNDESSDSHMNGHDTPSNSAISFAHINLKRKAEDTTSPHSSTPSAAKRPALNPFKVETKRWDDDDLPFHSTSVSQSSRNSSPRSTNILRDCVRDCEVRVEKIAKAIRGAVKRFRTSPNDEEWTRARLNFKQKKRNEVECVIDDFSIKEKALLDAAQSDLDNANDSQLETMFAECEALKESVELAKANLHQLIADAMKLFDECDSPQPDDQSGEVSNGVIHSNGVSNGVKADVNEAADGQAAKTDELADLTEKEREAIKLSESEPKNKEERDLARAIAESMSEIKQPDEDELDTAVDTIPQSPEPVDIPILPKMECDDEPEAIPSPVSNGHSDGVNARYKLTAAVIHRGVSSSSGHYVTDVLHQEKGQPVWRQFDDQYVIRHTDDKHMMTQWAKEGYILFFQLQP